MIPEVFFRQSGNGNIPGKDWFPQFIIPFQIFIQHGTHPLSICKLFFYLSLVYPKIEIQSIEILYDATGEAVIGYSVELDQGYVVVSAYVDMPSLILEWSDTAIPLYEEFNVTNVEKVLYINTLEYYCADKTRTLYTIDGVEVSSEGLTNTLVEMRDVSNIDANVLDSIVSMKEENEYGLMPYDDTAGGVITDPFTYAKNVYGGTWTSNEWANNWEN